MARESYEFRGHNFFVRTAAMGLQHAFSFSISLRLPTNSYWTAYFLWLEQASASTQQYLDAHGKRQMIARGHQSVATVENLEGGMTPKDLLDFESSASLTYSRAKGVRISHIVVHALGKSRDTNRVMRFHMMEESPSPEDGRIELSGSAGRFRPGGRDQLLHRGGPLASSPEFWRSTFV